MSVTIALAGNPNCGKTTLFNALTGAKQYVGNWPGVTVEKKEGKLKGNKDVIVTDLPGIYSLSPYTLEEVVSRDYLLKERPDVIVNLVDGTNIERNLYLTTQLREIGIPVVIALNMMDLVEKKGDKIDTAKLSAELGCEIVEISALKNKGIDQLMKKAIDTAYGAKQADSTETFAADIEEAIAKVTDLLPKSVPVVQRRWYAVKLFEKDEKILEQVKLSTDNKTVLDQIVAEAEARYDDDTESIITDQRYTLIQKVIAKSVKKTGEKLSTSDKIDRIVTNRWLGIPIFLGVMWLVYFLSVTTMGGFLTDFTNDTLFGEWIQPAVGSLLENAGASEVLVSLVVDGIIGGIGAVLGFAPQMVVLFFFLSLLEDCGYMVRIAFVMDRIFRKFGLSGKSFIPLLISSGCGIPGIMSTKTIENDNDRRLTIMTCTNIPCGAKLPIIALVAGVLFGNNGNLALGMYFMGIAAVLVTAIMLKKTKPFHGEAAPFVMELPAYHIPSFKGVWIHVWERIKGFLIKAGTILFIACAVMWFLGSFGFADGSFGLVDSEDCLLASIGGFIAPLFAPLGFGNWRAVAASLSGFTAKESIVTTIGVLSGVGELAETDSSLWAATSVMIPTGLAAVSFLIFNLLDSPCLAAISTMAKEMNSKKWTAFALIYQNVFAYLVTLMVYQFGNWFINGVFGVGTVVSIVVFIVMMYFLFRPDPYKNQSFEVRRSVAE